MSLRKSGRILPKALLSAAFAMTGSSAFATQFVYSVHLDGPSESPAQPTSNGIGDGTVIYDNSAHTLALSLVFSGLTGTVTQTHFHATTGVSGLPDNNPPGETADQAANAAGAVGIAVGNTSLPNFPLGVQSGVYTQTLDMTQANIYNTSFLNTTNGGNVAAAEATFAAALASGKTYWNIHTSAVPGGEIRGFPSPVPEPASAGLLAIAGSALAMRRRKE